MLKDENLIKLHSNLQPYTLVIVRRTEVVCVLCVCVCVCV